MIVTLTPDPCLGRTIEIDRLVPGAAHQVGASRLEAGGKGLDVSRALTRNGVATHAVLPAGGPAGAQLEALLAAGPVPHSTVPVTGATRVETTILDAAGHATSLTEPGPQLRFADVHALVSQVAKAFGDDGPDVAEPGWLAVCGSLGPDVPPDVYAIIADAAQARGARFAVDIGGPGLRHALSAGPDLVKTDLDELSGHAGRRLDGLADVVTAAGKMRDAGARAVLVGLGARGAVLLDDAGAHFGSAKVSRPRSTAGAADAMFAGYLSRNAGDPEQALATALAWGAAATSLPGRVMPGPLEVSLPAVVLPGRPDLTMRWPTAG